MNVFRHRGCLLPLIYFCILVPCCHGVTSEAIQDTTGSQPPNILLLLTDDQDVLVGGTEHMPLLNKLLAQQGKTFSNAFVHTPICCPSRSSILSGRYLHNGGALNNSVSGNCNGDLWRQGLEQDTFAVLAQAAGYQTGYAGKYLNAYGLAGCSANETDDGVCRRVPPGWNKWLGLVGNSVYYHYKAILSDDGGASTQIQRHNASYHADYLPDLVANRTLDMIREFSDASTAGNPPPFLIATAWPTPHAPFTPAPEDHGVFDGLKAHRTPNYNTSRKDNSQKHWFMRQLAAIDDETEQWIDNAYQLRHEALLSIDRHIQRFVDTLEELGQLQNTYIIYTSDNGWQMGQHRIRGDKRQLYEHDIRVPMIVRGPGVPPGSTMDLAVLNIDIAPTITEIATGSSPAQMDGMSFLSLLGGRNPPSKDWRNDFLVSYHGEGAPPCNLFPNCPPPPAKDWHDGDCKNNTFNCVRTVMKGNSMYCSFEDDENFVEYYNLEDDPWQLHNAANQLDPEERFAFQVRLKQLLNCRGETCRRLDGGKLRHGTSPLTRQHD